MHALADESLARIITQTVVACVTCDEDKAVVRDTRRSTEVPGQVPGRVDEVERAIAEEIDRAFVWPKGRNLLVFLWAREVDKFDPHGVGEGEDIARGIRGVCVFEEDLAV